MKQTLKISGYLLGVTFLGILAWANWEAPSLHQYLPEMKITSFDLSSKPTTDQAIKMEALLFSMKGITSSSTIGNLITVTYHPDETTEQAIMGSIQKEANVSLKKHTWVSDPTVANGPECPVPQNYILAIERMKFALNIRRLFITVK